jgi:pilus assembly protein CpaB
MKPKQLMLFAVAIGCGLVAMFGAQQILSGNRPADQAMVKILIAKVDIDPGIPLDKTNVGFKDWPKDAVPEGAITTEEEFTDHALRHRLSPNMPILISELGVKGAFGIASMIPKGMQVVSLPVDATMTHSGLLRPGSFVDISCVVDQIIGNGRTKASVKPLLNRVKVFAVGDKVAGTEVAVKDGNSVEVKNISFLTFPIQAKLLLLAKVVSNGRMQIAMLGEADKSTEDNRDLDEDSLAQKTNELFGDKGTELLDTRPLTPKVEKVDLPPKDRPTGSSFSEYLKQQPVAPEVAELGKRPARATWKIEIYNGDKKDIHELELPDDEPAAQPAVPPMSQQWTAPLMQFFSSRKRITEPATRETTTEASDEVAPSSGDKSAANFSDAVRK